MNFAERRNRFVPHGLLSSPSGSIAAMAAMIEVSDAGWALVDDLFDPPVVGLSRRDFREAGSVNG